MNKIISPFQMIENKVVSFEMKQNEVENEYHMTNVALGADYNLSDISNNENKLKAHVNLMITLRGITDAEEELFDIALNMLGVFTGDMSQLDEKKFSEMLKLNGISTLMQLSRAYITSVTALSEFKEPIRFPMVNVFELVKMKECKRNT